MRHDAVARRDQEVLRFVLEIQNIGRFAFDQQRIQEVYLHVEYVLLFCLRNINVRRNRRRQLALDAFIRINGGRNQPKDQEEEGDVRHRARIDFL